MATILNLLLFVLILGFIVFVHEFGHFIMAKKAGVYVYEFSIGMGPKVWSKQGKETEYSLRAIPIGGFCAMAGEDLDDDELKKIPKKKRLQAKNAWQRFLIMFFGAGNNFISAILILFLMTLIWGGNSMEPVIKKVEKGYPAQVAGIEAGDRVVELNGKKIKTSDDLSLYLAVSDPTKKNTWVVEKENGDVETYKIKAKKEELDGQESYVYGITIHNKKTKGFVNAIVYTGKKTASIFKQMAVTVGYLVTGGIGLSQLSGPIGIYSVVGESSKAGLQNILYLVAFLSINVGFINLLPLPAFDGGHILFIIIEKIKGSPVDPDLENKIHMIGMFLLLLLMFIITVNDIIRLF